MSAPRTTLPHAGSYTPAHDRLPPLEVPPVGVFERVNLYAAKYRVVAWLVGGFLLATGFRRPDGSFATPAAQIAEAHAAADSLRPRVAALEARSDRVEHRTELLLRDVCIRIDPVDAAKLALPCVEVLAPTGLPVGARARRDPR
ncbi:MAG: hypothetical protein ACJ8AO_05520 [Gemmatimonadaceae bacterium]